MQSQEPAPGVGDIVPVLAPLMNTLTGLADAAEEMSGSGAATASSQAMSELSHEAEIAGPGFDEPVHAAHSLAGILRFASTDALRQLVRLFEGQPVPVYAHLAVARMGLETAAYSHWAAASGIGVVARVQRLQLLRLRNSIEMKRSPISDYRVRGKVVMDQIRGQCQERGWTAIANEKQVKVDDELLPGSGGLIKILLAQGKPVPTLERLGATAWWFQSGVSHGLTYALNESIDTNPIAGQSPLVRQAAAIFTSSRSVSLQAIIFGLGYRNMIEGHRLLFGWSSHNWDSAVRVLVAEYQKVTSTPP